MCIAIYLTNLITMGLIVLCLLSTLMIPWGKVYIVQHMNSRRTNRRSSRDKSSLNEPSTSDDDNSDDGPHLELEDNRSRDGSVTAVDMEEEKDIASVVGIEMEEEGGGT